MSLRHFNIKSMTFWFFQTSNKGKNFRFQVVRRFTYRKQENCALIYEVISQPSPAVREKKPRKVSRMWSEAHSSLQPDLLPAIFGSHERIKLLEAASTNCPFKSSRHSLPSFLASSLWDLGNRKTSLWLQAAHERSLEESLQCDFQSLFEVKGRGWWQKGQGVKENRLWLHSVKHFH